MLTSQHCEVGRGLAPKIVISGRVQLLLRCIIDDVDDDGSGGGDDDGVEDVGNDGKIDDENGKHDHNGSYEHSNKYS